MNSWRIIAITVVFSMVWGLLPVSSDSAFAQVNNPPQPATALPNQSFVLDVDPARTLDARGTFSDSETLTFAVSSGNDAIATVSIDSDGTNLVVTPRFPGVTDITITATNAESQSSESKFKVTVNRNDAPVFDTPDTVSYDWFLGRDVGSVQLAEARGGNGALTYSIAPALPAGLSFDQANATITGTPTSISETQYLLTVQDGDDDQDPSDSDTLEIGIGVETDYSVYLYFQPYQNTVIEGSTARVYAGIRGVRPEVGSPAAKEPITVTLGVGSDSTATVSSQISSLGSITIPADERSGSVDIMVPENTAYVPAEKLVIEITNASTPSHSSVSLTPGRSSVELKIVDSGQNAAPSFSTDQVRIRVPEGTYPEEVLIGQVTATDPDSDILTYSLEPSPQALQLFGIDADDGSIFIEPESRIDWSENKQFELTVNVRDGYQNTGTVRIDTENDATKTVTIVVVNIAEDGVLELSSETVVVGEPVSVSLTDDDGGIDNLGYQWQIETAGVWGDVGTDSATYTPVAGDVSKRLRVLVTYDDVFGTNNQVGLDSAHIPQVGSAPVQIPGSTPGISTWTTPVLGRSPAGTVYQDGLVEVFLDTSFTVRGNKDSLAGLNFQIDPTLIRFSATHTGSQLIGTTGWGYANDSETLQDSIVVRLRESDCNIPDRLQNRVSDDDFTFNCRFSAGFINLGSTPTGSMYTVSVEARFCDPETFVVSENNDCAAVPRVFSAYTNSGLVAYSELGASSFQLSPFDPETPLPQPTPPSDDAELEYDPTTQNLGVFLGPLPNAIEIPENSEPHEIVANTPSLTTGFPLEGGGSIGEAESQDSVSYGLVSHLDSQFFGIDPTTGQIFPTVALDYENPMDGAYTIVTDERTEDGFSELVLTFVASDNRYYLIPFVSDGRGAVDFRDITSFDDLVEVRVTDVPESESLSVPETTPRVGETITLEIEGDEIVEADWYWSYSYDPFDDFVELKPSTSELGTSTYTLTADDVGKYIEVVVRYRDNAIAPVFRPSLPELGPYTIGPIAQALPTPGPDTAPDFGTVPAQTVTVVSGEELTPFELPVAMGGNGALTYVLSDLPTGLSYDPLGHQIIGSTTVVGDTTATLRVHDSDEIATTADSDSISISISVVSLLSPEPAIVTPLEWNVGVGVDLDLPAADSTRGATAPITLSLLDLPPGLSFESEPPRIVGVPLSLSPLRELAFTATDAIGLTQILSLPYQVGPAPADKSPFFTDDELPQISIDLDTPYSHQLPLALGGDGFITYSISPDLPTGLELNPTNPTITGTVSSIPRGTWKVTATDMDGSTDSYLFRFSGSTVAPPTAVMVEAGDGMKRDQDRSMSVSWTPPLNPVDIDSYAISYRRAEQDGEEAGLWSMESVVAGGNSITSEVLTPDTGLSAGVYDVRVGSKEGAEDTIWSEMPAQVTIAPPITLSFTTRTISAREVTTGSDRNIRYSVGLSGARSTEVSYRINYSNVTASNADYNWVPITRTIRPGRLGLMLGDFDQSHIQPPFHTVQNDNLVEGDETFTARLTVTNGEVIADTRQATVTISDDDTAEVGLMSPSVVSVHEDVDGGTENEFEFELTLSAEVVADVTVDWELSGAETNDVVGGMTTGTVTFSQRSTAPQMVTITVADDEETETAENWTFSLSDPSAAFTRDQAPVPVSLASAVEDVMLTVEASDIPPQLGTELEDQSFVLGIDPARTLDASGTLTDSQALEFSASSDNAEIASVSIQTDGTGLVLTPLFPGITTIRIEATDTAEESSESTFEVSVLENLAPVFDYPDTVSYDWDVGEDVGSIPLATARGGDGTLTYSISPDLPDGLSFDSSSTTVTGTPTAATTSDRFVLIVQDADADQSTSDSDMLEIAISVETEFSVHLLFQPFQNTVIEGTTGRVYAEIRGERPEVGNPAAKEPVTVSLGVGSDSTSGASSEISSLGSITIPADRRSSSIDIAVPVSQAYVSGEMLVIEIVNASTPSHSSVSLTPGRESAVLHIVDSMQNAAPVFAAEPIRLRVLEGSYEEEVKIGQVTAIDPDNDILNYILAADPPVSDLFWIDSVDGSINIESGSRFDWSEQRQLVLTVNVTDRYSSGPPVAVNTDIDDTKTVTIDIVNVAEEGSVMLSSDEAYQGVPITAFLTDDDGGIDNVSYLWETETAGVWGAVGSDSETYTPTAADVGKRLRTQVTYDDSFGLGNRADLDPAHIVEVGAGVGSWTTPQLGRSPSGTVYQDGLAEVYLDTSLTVRGNMDSLAGFTVETDPTLVRFSATHTGSKLRGGSGWGYAYDAETLSESVVVPLRNSDCEIPDAIGSTTTDTDFTVNCRVSAGFINLASVADGLTYSVSVEAKFCDPTAFVASDDNDCDAVTRAFTALADDGIVAYSEFGAADLVSLDFAPSAPLPRPDPPVSGATLQYDPLTQNLRIALGPLPDVIEIPEDAVLSEVVNGTPGLSTGIPLRGGGMIGEAESQDTVSYGLVSHLDSQFFGIDPATGQVFPTVALDFENPQDGAYTLPTDFEAFDEEGEEELSLAAGDNVYYLIPFVSDGRGAVDIQEVYGLDDLLAVRVTDAPEPERLDIPVTVPRVGDTITLEIEGDGIAEAEWFWSSAHDPFDDFEAFTPTTENLGDSTYVLTADDFGKYIEVEVRYRDVHQSAVFPPQFQLLGPFLIGPIAPALIAPTPTPGPDTAPDFGTVPAQTITVVSGEEMTAFGLPEASGGNEGLVYTLSDLPTGLSYDPLGHQIVGTPTTTGMFTATLWVRDNDEVETLADTDRVSISISVVRLFATNTEISDTVWEIGVGVKLELPTIAGIGGVSTPITYSLSPDLPSGLSFDTETQTIVGLPLSLSPNQDYTYTATDTNGLAQSLNFSARVDAKPVDTDPFFPEEEIDPIWIALNATIRHQLPLAKGGDDPIAYSISPALPSGLELNTVNPVITGMVTAIPDGTWTITASDDDSSSEVYRFSFLSDAVSTETIAVGRAKTISFSDLFPVDATSPTYTVASSDTAIVTVTDPILPGATGFDITGVADGTTTVTVTIDDGEHEPVDHVITVTTVMNAAPTIQPSASSTALLAMGASDDISFADIFADDTTSPTYTVFSSDTAIVTVTDPIPAGATGFDITGVAEGLATVTVTIDDGANDAVMHSISVTVNNPPTALSTLPDLPMAGETLDETSEDITILLSGVFSDNDGLSYMVSSSDPSVATVSPALPSTQFRIDIVNVGTTNITVEVSDGVTDPATGQSRMVSTEFMVTVARSTIAAPTNVGLEAGVGLDRDRDRSFTVRWTLPEITTWIANYVIAYRTAAVGNVEAGAWSDDIVVAGGNTATEYVVTPTDGFSPGLYEVRVGSLVSGESPVWTATFSEVTITDPITLSFQTLNYTVNEGPNNADRTVEFPVGLLGTRSETVSYTIETYNDTTTDSDYDTSPISRDIASGTLGLAASDLTPSSIPSIAVVDDELVEGDEVFNASVIVDAGEVTWDDQQATVTIIDNDTAEVSLQTTNLSVPEDVYGEAASQFELTLSISKAVAADVTLDWALSGAETSDVTGGELGGEITFMAGSTQDQTLTIVVVDDDDMETEENWTFSLSNLETSLTRAQGPEPVSFASTVGDVDLEVWTSDTGFGPPIPSVTATQGGENGVDPDRVLTVSWERALGSNRMYDVEVASDASSSVLEELSLDTWTNWTPVTTTSELMATVVDPTVTQGQFYRFRVAAQTDATTEKNWQLSNVVSLTNPIEVSLSITEVEVVESDASVDIQLQMSGPKSEAVSVMVVLNPGTATTPGDYGEPSSGSNSGTGGTVQVDFAAEVTTATVTIPIINDMTLEGVETFTVGLGSSPSDNVEISDTETTVTITDDDAVTIGLSISDDGSNVAEIDIDEDRAMDTDPNNSVTLVLTLSGAAPEPVTLTLTASGNVKVDDIGWASLVNEVTIPANTTSHMVSLEINDDTRPEGEEAISVTVTDLELMLPGRDDAATVDPANDMVTITVAASDGGDPPPVVSAVMVSVGQEVDGNSVDTDRAISASWTLPTDTATVAGYIPRFAPAPAAGETVKETDWVYGTPVGGPTTNSMTITGALLAGTEYSVEISALEGSLDSELYAWVGAETSVTTGQAVQVSLAAPTSVVETPIVANTNNTVTVTASLPGLLSEAVSLELSTTAGTAVGNEDFVTLTTEMLTIAAGERTAEVDIEISDDDIVEGTENFTVSIVGDPTGTDADPNMSEVSVEITDDDTGLISIEWVGEAPTGGALPVVNEDIVSGSGGMLEYELSLDKQVAADVVVDWEIVTNSNVTSSDFSEGTSGQVTIPAGTAPDQGISFSVGIVDDTEPELVETVTLRLTNVAVMLTGRTDTPVTVDPAAGEVMATIAASDDRQPSNVQITAGDSSGYDTDRVFTISWAAPLSSNNVSGYQLQYKLVASPTWTDFHLESDTAVTSYDWAPEPRLPAGSYQVSVVAVGNDPHAVSAQTFEVAPIIASFAVSSLDITEGDTEQLTVTLSAPRSELVTVGISLTLGEASDTDFATLPQEVSFAVGETSMMIPISAVSDTEVEAAETFQIALMSPVQAGDVEVDTTPVTVTISDPQEPAQPTSPTNVRVTAGDAMGRDTDRTLTATWTAATDHTIVTGYQLRYKLDTDTTWSMPISVTDGASSTHTWTPTPRLAAGSYQVSVEAVGPSAPSPVESLGTATVIAPITVAISGTTLVVDEGSTAQLTITLSAERSVPVEVGIDVMSGTAAAADYEVMAQQVNFAVGETSQDIDVTASVDTTAEAAEIFTIVLRSPALAGDVEVDTTTVTVTINNIGGTPPTGGGSPNFPSVGPTTQPPTQPPTTTPSFTDTMGNTHETNIGRLAELGITRGCNPPENTRYCPDRAVTRGEMATFMVRAFSLPASGSNLFEDDNGNTHETNINALATAGITRGCNPPENTRYCPNRPVTRAQMATFIARALGLADGSGDFIDTSESVHQDDINRIATVGITRGCNPPSNTRYCPERAVTRAEMATFLIRATDLVDGS